MSIYYCKQCLKDNTNDKKIRFITTKSGRNIKITESTVVNGIIELYNDSEKQSICPYCNNLIKKLYLNKDELNIIIQISNDIEFLLNMDQLKQDDIIEFNLKMTQFKQSVPQEQDNTPKCPTCGSANIKKISPTKRWVSTGLLGISSSLVTHTMECNDCGYKF